MEQRVNFSPDTKFLVRIGAGHCGSVWAGLSDNENLKAPLALKREDGGPGRSIENEVNVQSQVCRETTAGSSQTLVPHCFGLMKPDDESWHQVLSQLPQGFERCNAMVSEKVRSVSEIGRRCLTENYCPEDMQQQIADSPQNRHCLVRVYLGRRRIMHQLHHPVKRLKFFSLRNFPLHADQAEELNLPYEAYARAMGEAMAILHWKVRTDGADVEFVLGAPRWTGTGAEDEADSSLELGKHPLWMLDFDCSRPVKADESGIEAMARAFWRNDPYFPRPHQPVDRDQRLWEIFAAEYKQTGTKMVETSSREGENVKELQRLVHRTIQRIEEWKAST